MWKCSSYAGMMELGDMRDLGDVTSVKVFRPIIRRAHSLVKTGSSCFIDASQAQRSVSAPRRVKTEGNKIAAGSPAAHICGYGGIGRRAGFRFLCRKACGFDPHYPHKRKSAMSSQNSSRFLLYNK